MGFKEDNSVVGYVYETRNYEQFKTLLGNRDVTEERVHKIEQSMLAKQLPIPCVVNEKLEVIDGQGRLAVSKKHELPIYFTVVPGLTIDDCVTANIYSTNWSLKDIIDRYAKTGNKSYQRLRALLEDSGFKIYTVLCATGKSATHTKDKMVLKRGQIEISETDFAVAKDRLRKASEVCDAIQAHRSDVNGREIIAQAIIRCTKTDGYDHRRMVKVCHENALVYVDSKKVVQVLEQIKEFYNRSKKTDFMDVYGKGNSLNVTFGNSIRR